MLYFLLIYADLQKKTFSMIFHRESLKYYTCFNVIFFFFLQILLCYQFVSLPASTISMWLSGTCFSWCRHLSGPMICLWKTTGAKSKLNTAGSDPLFTNGCRSEFSCKTHTYIHECYETLREQFEFSKGKTGEWNKQTGGVEKQLVPTMHMCNCAYTPCVRGRGVFRTEKPNSEPRYRVWPASSLLDNSWQAKLHGRGMFGLPRKQLLDSPPSEYRKTQSNKHLCFIVTKAFNFR